MPGQSLRITRAALLIAAACAITCAAGCKTAVDWELGTFHDAYEKSVKEKKPTFVYFRSWYSVDCTNFEDNVLSHPRVLAALKSVVSVPLEYDWDKSLADKWGITRTPGTAVIDNHKQLLAKTNGVVSVQQLLDALNGAIAQVQPQSAPAAANPTVPPPRTPQPTPSPTTTPAPGSRGEMSPVQ